MYAVILNGFFSKRDECSYLFDSIRRLINNTFRKMNNVYKKT